MVKKYRYNIALIAEEEVCGTIDLTKKEAADLVEYLTNSENWKNIQGGDYCGHYCGCFKIDIDNPMEIPNE